LLVFLTILVANLAYGPYFKEHRHELIDTD
jgi:hypothetical protein